MKMSFSEAQGACARRSSVLETEERLNNCTLMNHQTIEEDSLDETEDKH